MRRTMHKGFTLIELLVIVAILGVLAAAILAAINPVEQINKSRDTTSRTNAYELAQASERYMAIREDYPWVVAAIDCPSIGAQCTNDAELIIGDADSPDIDAILSTLLLTKEIKPAFQSSMSSANTLMLTKEVDEDGLVSVCYEPRSESFRIEALERCSSGGPGGTVGGTKNAVDTIACPEADYSGSPAYNGELICVP